MVDWLTEPLGYDFLREALAASVLAAVVCSLTGSWVVVRGMSFIGDALAHGIIPGVAIAFQLGASLVVGAVASALVMALGITLVTRRGRVGDDTAIGLLFVGMLAVGVIVLSRSTERSGDLTDLLFGSILAVDAGDLWLLGVAALVTMVLVTVFHRSLLALAFNRRKAATLGLHPRAAHALLLVLVTLAVVSSFQAVGTLMVFGLLVGPPATAALLTRRMPPAMVVAVLVGVLDATVGLLLSYHARTAAGASIAAVAVGVFLVVFAGREALEAWQRAHPGDSGRHQTPTPPAPPVTAATPPA